MDSRTLQAKGLDAAVDPTPHDNYVPKGEGDEAVAPPAPAFSPSISTVKAADSYDDPNYFYAGGWRTISVDSLGAAVTIGRPTLGRGDLHTLAELAVQSGGRKATIEVGWSVDRAAFGDSDPHLFTFYWVNGQEGCYNVCTQDGKQWFVPSKGSVLPGSTLPSGVVKSFAIKHSDGAWWIWYDSDWIGYYPDETWTSAGTSFTQSDFVQAFGEVASDNDRPCSAMGNGQSVESGYAARFQSFQYGTVSDKQFEDLGYFRNALPLDKLLPWTYQTAPRYAKGALSGFFFGGPSPC